MDLALWYAARVAAMAALVLLSASLVTGMALRTAYLSALARNRALLQLHGFLSWFWVPLVLVHITCLVLDGTARIALRDVFIPFQVHYATGAVSSDPTLAVGLGTIGFLSLVLIWITSVMRRRMSARVFRAIHLLSYPTFALFFLHAQLAGTDLSRAVVSVIAWSAAGILLMLALLRALGGRVVSAADLEA